MGVDVARGVAVIGMIGAHVGLSQTFDWARVETWTDLVHGRSSILFALLAGVSIALLTGGRRIPAREDLPTLRLRLVGRGAAVFAIGLVLELLNTGVAVILTVYGILFVVVIPFLRLRRRTLWLVAIGLALVGPVVLAALGVLSLGALGSGLDLVVFGIYPVSVWLALLLAGMAIGRSDLRRTRTAVVLLLAGAALAAPATAIAGAVGPSDDGSMPASVVSDSGLERSQVPMADLPTDGLVCDQYTDGAVFCAPEGASGSADVPKGTYLEQVADADLPAALLSAVTDASPHSGGTLEVLGSGGFAAAVLGLCLLLSRPLRWLLLPVAALGSMPLSAYSAHIVAILFAGGLMSGVLGHDDSFWLFLSLSLLAATTLWMMFVGTGPLERLTRRASDAMALAPATTLPAAENVPDESDQPAT